jgi:hypothetical protein
MMGKAHLSWSNSASSLVYPALGKFKGAAATCTEALKLIAVSL